MKRGIIAFFLGIGLLLVAPAGATLAQVDESAADIAAEEEVFLPSPTSPFYFLQTWREKFEDLAARTPEAKAEVALKQARRRLMEMEQLAEEDSDKAEALLARWQERHEERIQAAEENAATAGEKKEQIEQQIIEKRQEHLKRLEQIRDQVPEKAQSALQKAIDKQTDSLKQWQERFPQPQELRIELQEQEQQQEQVRDRFPNEGGTNVPQQMLQEREVNQTRELQELRPETGESEPDVDTMRPQEAAPVAPRLQVRGTQTEQSPAQQLWDTVVSWFE